MPAANKNKTIVVNSSTGAAKPKASAVFVAALVVGMVVMGSLNTILLKMQLETTALGIDGTVHKFAHPWFQTLNMFMGECLCLVVFYVGVSLDKRAALAQFQQEGQNNAAEKFLRGNTLRFTNLPDDDSVEDPSATSQQAAAYASGTPRTVARVVEDEESKFKPMLMLLPGMCDLMGTTLSGVGLLMIPASIWQMLRGSIILFTGLLSRVVLKRTLHNYNYLGMAVVTAGLGLVGYAAVGTDPSDPNQTIGENLLGMGLVLLGMMLNAVQFVLEETMLKDKQYPPLKVVGWEGIWGASVTAFVALPICYFIMVPEPKDKFSGMYVLGHYENILDVFVMFSNNTALVMYSVSALFTIASYNYFGLSISQHVSSLTRAVLDSLRTIVIWAWFIFLYYYNNDNDRGEEWTSNSWYEVAGFTILVTGTLIYSAAIRLPGMDYSHLDAATQYKPAHRGSRSSRNNNSDLTESFLE
jgi:drug/metabolite transporter (DMT)-like permease